MIEAARIANTVMERPRRLQRVFEKWLKMLQHVKGNVSAGGARWIQGHAKRSNVHKYQDINGVTRTSRNVRIKCLRTSKRVISKVV